MCTNYRPTSREMIEDYFGAPAPAVEFREDAYPGYAAPIVRLAQQDGHPSERRECIAAVFGLIPAWSKDGKNYRSTYNSRSETIFLKPSYRHAWKKRQFCIVPMAAFYEPNYESGKPIRWRIERQDRKPFGVAAIYDHWKNPNGEWIPSFSLITVNADLHPVMGRFHAPGDEKRSIVVIDSDHYADWLRASTDEAVTYFSPVPADTFTTLAAPKVKPPA
jgi:putative SOS response-associated peptidase YedK